LIIGKLPIFEAVLANSRGYKAPDGGARTNAAQAAQGHDGWEGYTNAVESPDVRKHKSQTKKPD
jgi:hypothetical protein